MCDSIKENLPFLHLLARTTSDSQLSALLETATPSQVRVLSEISYHVLTGRCKFTGNNRALLRSKIKTLKRVGDIHRSYGSKKRRISGQRGGAFFSLIAPLLATVLPALLSK